MTTCSKCGRTGTRGFRTNRLRQTVCTATRACHFRAKHPALSDAEYAQRLAAQGGGCAICGTAPTGSRRLDVDHDHRTGEVRGLLCFTCNHYLLGKYATADKLLAASMYLRGHARADGVSWLGWVLKPGRAS